MPPERGTLQLTTPRELAVAALAGGVIAWFIVATANALTGRDPLLPWTGPAVLVFVAAVVLVTYLVARHRFRTNPRDIEPQQAVTFLVLGKAAALGGAIIGAGYLVFALLFVRDISAEGPRERVIRGAVAAVAGAITMVAGLLLERQCRVPDPPEGSESAEGSAED